MISQSVISENKGHEGYWIAFLCALILMLGTLLLPYNSVHEAHQPIAEHQVLITDLTPSPLAMIGELRLAHEEIRYLYQDEQTWPKVEMLEESWLPPFVKDKSWEHQGEQQWIMVAPGVYQSKPALGGARYLLNSQQKVVDIWLDQTQQATLFPVFTSANSSVFSMEGLIASGWTQVVFADDPNEPTHHH